MNPHGRLTVEHLGDMPNNGDRYEVAFGEMFASPAADFTHQRILAKLGAAFENYLERNPVGEFAPRVRVIFDQYDAVLPDMVFVSRDRLPGALARGRLIAAPDLAVEILSPGASNERLDRRVKLQMYSSGGVREYWIVDAATRSVDIFRSDGACLTLAQSLKPGDSLSSPLLPGFSVPVAALFASRFDQPE